MLELTAHLHNYHVWGMVVKLIRVAVLLPFFMEQGVEADYLLVIVEVVHSNVFGTKVGMGSAR